MKIMFDDEIDEEHYLQENPDVRKAVESGAIPSGNYHFKGIGYVEGRKFRWKSASDDVAEKTDPAPASKQPLTAEKANPIKGADAPPAIEKAPPPTGPAQSPGTEKPPTKGPSAPPPKTPGPFFPSR
ncbi:hypothetical protein GJ654_11505 [Rhodoblastus acidophilus]|uniref:Uncharacterized protein n=1 Tax=Rhodoblastus acidophilus TaxID=1074 RepID=A0A6N8DMQ4_RHOAC|nr:hypothetical protein [Rhodoblastus acidophilus]MCW2274663.1 putative membrane protein [Rhodoblastus acidophilus]MTV31618.1 hypothetical protein [Rhodoblastus acidophilus]